MKLARSETHRVYSWDDWVEVCRTYKENPYECYETGHDIGGGDGVYFEYWGKCPEEEE